MHSAMADFWHQISPCTHVYNTIYNTIQITLQIQYNINYNTIQQYNTIQYK